MTNLLAGATGSTVGLLVRNIIAVTPAGRVKENAVLAVKPSDGQLAAVGR